MKMLGNRRPSLTNLSILAYGEACKLKRSNYELKTKINNISVSNKQFLQSYIHA